MIGKIFAKSAGSFKGRIEYIFGLSKHDHAISLIKTIGGNFFTQDPLPYIQQNDKSVVTKLVREFDEIENLRKQSIDNDRDIKPVFHAMLSLRPGEKLTNRQWATAVEKYLTDLGFNENNKYVAVLHEDTDHQHVHIVANRIKFEEEFPMVKDSNERHKSIDSASEIEDMYGLSKAPLPEETWGTALTHKEVQASIRDGELPFKHRLIAKIAGAIEKTNATSGDMFTFVKLLRHQKVYIHLTKDSEGQPKGITFEHQGKMISGRQLKRSRLTWQKLTTQENIHYDPETLSALETEIGRREDGDFEVVTVKTRYYVFTSRRRRLYIKFNSREEQTAQMIMAILDVLLSIFGIKFSAQEHVPGAWYEEYVPGKEFRPSFQDPKP